MVITRRLNSLANILRYPLYLGLFGGALYLIPTFFTNLYTAIAFAVLMILVGLFVGWKNTVTYAEDGARLTKAQMKTGLDEYLRMVREVKEQDVENQPP